MEDNRPYYSLYFYQHHHGDRINVGMLMFNKSGCICQTSEDRVKLVKPYLKTGYTLFKYAVKSYEETFNKLMIPTLLQVRRLSIYSNGMLGIEKPRLIDIEFTQENFDKLFEKLIDYNK